MKKKKKTNDPDMQKVESALIRAGQKARQIARQTNTPLIVIENGKVVDKDLKDLKE